MKPQNGTTEGQVLALQGSEEAKQATNDLPVVNMLNRSQKIEVEPPTLLAWSSYNYNNIRVIELETKQNYANFEGVQINFGWWTYVKEISNTKLLVSLHHNDTMSANMEIFDLSQKAVKKIYAFEEVCGVTGWGDCTYNSRRGLLGSIPFQRKIAYHLYHIDYSGHKSNYVVKLLRKPGWHAQFNANKKNCAASFDFDPRGETIATLDRYGICLLSDVDTNKYILHIDLGEEDYVGRCRWSTNTNESLLFVKYGLRELNIIDVEKKALILKRSVQIDKKEAYWLDVCPIDGNMLALGGQDNDVKIFDKRESKVVKYFDGIHTDCVGCVRWSSLGDMLASASNDETVKLLDFKTGKVQYTGTTFDGSNPLY